MTRSLATGTAVGIVGGAVLFALGTWAFIKGCPLVDWFIEHDTTAPF